MNPIPQQYMNQHLISRNLALTQPDFSQFMLNLYPSYQSLRMTLIHPYIPLYPNLIPNQIINLDDLVEDSIEICETLVDSINQLLVHPNFNPNNFVLQYLDARRNEYMETIDFADEGGNTNIIQ